MPHHGVGAVLAHKEKDGTERSISYASCSLAMAERKYSQLDKEGLAIIFAVKNFINICMDENLSYIHLTNHSSTYLETTNQFLLWPLLEYRDGL